DLPMAVKQIAPLKIEKRLAVIGPAGEAAAVPIGHAQSFRIEAVNVHGASPAYDLSCDRTHCWKRNTSNSWGIKVPCANLSLESPRWFISQAAPSWSNTVLANSTVFMRSKPEAANVSAGKSQSTRSPVRVGPSGRSETART